MQAPNPATYPSTTRVPSNTTLTASGSPDAETHNSKNAEKNQQQPYRGNAGGQEEKDIVVGVDEDQAIDGVDPVYAAKARVLNRAIMDIGMGRYQWQLFFCIGYGWAMDNMVSHGRDAGPA